ncbi:MAG: cytochrome d ubiquinol oxidase subunit II [Hyphomonadaceae bacterium]|nr:cytochrome d ubiquinol oxidase subunit II [Hyphomonadaceae bacterium]
MLERARRFGTVAAALTIALFAAGGLWVALGDMGLAIQGAIDTGGPSNPHIAGAAVVAAQGAWVENYARYPAMLAAPLLGLAGPVLALVGIRTRGHVLNFLGTSLATVGIIATAGLSMFPFILPSATDPGSSLTVWNASSSHLTLWIMLIVTIIFLPIVLAYTAWAMRVLFGRLSIREVVASPDFY